MELCDKIIEIIRNYSLRLKYSKVVFGAHYLAYKNDDNNLVLCSCDKKSIDNRIKLYDLYQEEFTNENLYYRDYSYYKDYSPLSLEQFLGLPKELNIDYTKDTLNQISFEDNICHRCCGVDYEWIIPQKNPFNYKSVAKQVRNARRDLEKENYFISKGFLYIPTIIISYVLVDELSAEAKEILRPKLEDFLIRDKYYIGPNQFEANKYKYKQISEINNFLSLPLDIQLKFLYRNYTQEERIKLANSFDKTLLNLANECSRETEKAVNTFEMKSIDKKVRDLQSFYTKSFPISTSPLEDIIKLYEEGLQFDYMYYDVDEVFLSTEEKQQYYDFCKEIIPFLNLYIDLGGDINISLKTQLDDIVEPIKYLILLTKDNDLMQKAGMWPDEPFGDM